MKSEDKIELENLYNLKRKISKRVTKYNEILGKVNKQIKELRLTNEESK